MAEDYLYSSAADYAGKIVIPDDFMVVMNPTVNATRYNRAAAGARQVRLIGWLQT